MSNHHITHHQHHFHHKNMFIPIFCRLSLKDITLNNNNNHNTNQVSTDEPSSPKVSCMGQVKRNNRVIGSTSTAIITTSNSNSNQNNHKYTKLKRFFSSKALLPPAPNNAWSGNRSCRTSKDKCERRLRVSKNEDDRVLVNVEEMDPPLPVVKKVAPLGEVNIWKRRFNGTKMNGLQIEQIRLPDCKVMDQPTV